MTPNTCLTEPINAEALLQTFLDMVKINSPSGAEGPLRDYLLQRMETLKALCPDVTHHVDDFGNLIVDIPKEQCGHDQILVLSAHLDVVPPCLDIQPMLLEEDGEIIVQSDNTTVLGADDKAGLAPIFEAVHYSLLNKTPRPALRLLLTLSEEIGLLGAKALEQHWLDSATFAITFDHTGEQGLIIYKAPSYVGYSIAFGGKSVHAGIMPEQGVNAIVFAANVIRQMPQGRLDAVTTANVGKILGGKGTNVVPDLVEITGELRGHDDAVIEGAFADIQSVLEREHQAMPGTSYTFEQQRVFTRYELPTNHPGIERIVSAMTMLGIAPLFQSTNGGSDNHVFVQRGLPGVVLSAAYIEPHSLKERVKLSDMVTCTHLILEMMRAFSEEAIQP